MSVHEYYKLDSRSLTSLLEYAYTQYSDRECVGFVDEDMLLYGEFYQKVQETKAMLLEAGITKGDKVAILSENMPHWGVAYFAITTLGAVAVPILTDFHTNEVLHILNHSEAKAIFVSNKQLDTIYDAEIENLVCVISIETLSYQQQLCKYEKMRALLDGIKKQAQEIGAKFKRDKESESMEQDLAVIIYTSGTTGHSKGVMLSHSNLVSNAMAAKSVVDIVPEDRFLSILPLAHALECTVGFLIPILHGSSIRYIKKAPTPSVLLKALSSVRPTYMLSVPLIIEKIYRSKVLSAFKSSWLLSKLYEVPFFRKMLNKKAGKKLYETFGGELKFFGIGGSKLSKSVEDFLYEANFPFAIGYGLSETAPLVAGKRPFLYLPGSTGPAVEGVEIKIAQPQGHFSDGEILVRGPNVMMGYYKDEAKTAEVLDEQGWFHTGDLGYLDEQGNLYIRGRSKNVIVGASGENIYPEQIEAIINLNPYVLDALVLESEGKLVARIHLDYELIDKEFDANSHSEAQMHKRIEELLESIRIESNEKLSSFSKVSRFIEQSEPFIKTPTKKIKRFLYAEV